MTKYLYRCSVCKGVKGESVFRGERGFYFCEEDSKNFCNYCKTELTQQERDILPKYLCRGGLHKLCLNCLKSELEKDKAAKVKELEIEIKKFNFQIQFQNCLKCSEINDSRDSEGRIKYRFCTKCRKEHSIKLGDNLFIERLGKTMRTDSIDKRTTVFDKVVGVRDRNE